MSKRIVVFGATGNLGRHVVKQALVRGHHVVAVSRDVERAQRLFGSAPEQSLTHCSFSQAPDDEYRGDTWVSAIGAPVNFGFMPWSSYRVTERRAHERILTLLRTQKPERMVFVSVFGASSMQHLDYVRGHEIVVEALRQTGVPLTVIRPTGFFSANDVFLSMARFGTAAVIGDGASRTNPIHDADLAAVIIDACTTDVAEVDVGGPETLSRREIALLAFAAYERRARIASIPPGVSRVQAGVLRPFHPRLSALLSFLAYVSTHDCIAPARGTMRIGQYFRAKVVAQQSLPSPP